MGDRKRMNLDSFDLLVRAMHREFLKNPKSISVQNSSVFFSGNVIGQNVHLFMTNDGCIWPTVGTASFEYYPPGFWAFKDKPKHLFLMKLINEMRGQGTDEVEAVICNAVPAAREVIAERVLVGDHKDAN